MKRFVSSLLILAAILVFDQDKTMAQVLDGIYVKEHVPARKQIPYKYLREGDVMWTKRVWRVIDLKEKVNFPMYYPTTPIGDRMSLVDLILWGIKTEGITPYNTDDDRFTQPITLSQIDVLFGAVPQTITFTNADGDMEEKTITGEMNTAEVKQYLIKEDWFFDRQHSIMDVRIIGICPVRFYVPSDQQGTEDAELRISPLFWIYFPEARRIFANHEVYNVNNDAERRTFDDIFFKRKFGSYIVRESNVQDDRQVSEYTLGIQSMLEGERLKKQISDYEQDLWNY